MVGAIFGMQKKDPSLCSTKMEPYSPEVGGRGGVRKPGETQRRTAESEMFEMGKSCNEFR